jgi:SAM-dependent methyltransferase
MPSTHWNARWARDFGRFRRKRRKGYYGDHWGDPSMSRVRYLWHRLRGGKRRPGDLSKVVKRYLRPYVEPESVVLEIGAGGGRWTQYLITARQVVIAELNPQFFDYLRSRFRADAAKLRFYQTSGYELAGIDAASIDFAFSFGTFVHIEPSGIDQYLGEIWRVLRPGAVCSIQYADRTKPIFEGAVDYGGFSNMNGTKMERFLGAHGFEIVEHDQALLNHSNIAVFRKPPGP